MVSTWPANVLAKDRVAEAIPVLVGLAAVAEQVTRERCPSLVARHAVVRWELVVKLPALWARHLCTLAIVA